ncbi:MAG: hypothetical protein ABI162_12560 [Luteolibacter sp.]
MKVFEKSRTGPRLGGQPADMLIAATGSDQSGEDFEIKVAFDVNNNYLTDY